MIEEIKNLFMEIYNTWPGFIVIWSITTFIGLASVSSLASAVISVGILLGIRYRQNR